MPAIVEAKKLGLYVIAADAETNPAGRDLADEFITLRNRKDAAPLLERVEKLKLGLAGALSYCSDVGQFAAAELRQLNNLHGDSIALTRLMMSKSLQREILKNMYPEGFFWQTCASEQDALSAVRQSDGAVIVKPVDSSGSRGVSRVSSDSEDLRERVRSAFAESGSNEVIVETFLEGVEYAVDGFVIDGKVTVLTILEKRRSPVNPMVATTLIAIDPQTEAFLAMSEFSARVISSFGKRHGPFHLEAILTPEGNTVLVEAAGRGGGFGLATEFISSLTGLNYAQLSVLDAIGKPISTELSAEARQRSGIMHFFSPGQEKMLVEFERLAREESANVAVDTYQVQNRRPDILSDGDRIGSAILLGDSQAEAETLFAKFQAKALRPE